jgi:Family of unknown function (DUF5317)
MALVLLMVVGAAAVALLTGGSWRALAGLPVKGGRLVVIAVAAQLAGGWLAELTNHAGFYVVGLVLTALAGGAFCVRNLRILGVPLITAGLVLNALAVIANGAMPVSRAAAERAGVSLTTISAGSDPRHVVAGAHTRLRPITDDIAVPLPGLPEVISLGDALIAAGLAELVFCGMRSNRRRRGAPAVSTSAAPAVAWLERDLEPTRLTSST